MKTEDFLVKLKEELDIENIELTTETKLKDLDEFDSLSVLSIIAMIDEEMGKKIPGKKFLTITTVQSLMELIGSENFE